MRRLYFFEIFVAVNLTVVAVVARETLHLVGSPVKVVGGMLLSMTAHAALGLAVRCAVAYARRDREYFRLIRSREWIADTARLIAGAALTIFTYGWIKLVVPYYHRRLFDQVLWDLEQGLFFGYAPTVFVLDLFGSGPFLRAMDWSYANIFLVSIVIAMAYFLSDPRRQVRIAFANGYAALWITGAWLYMLLPSIGPAYRFPDIWLAYGDTLRITQRLQALLMKNYRNVLTAAAGETRGGTSIVLGIAAFPSLHVAAQMYFFLWMRRLWTSGEVLFWIFVVVIFLGSMITGWHYFLDGVAGIALALACWAIFCRRGVPRDDRAR